LEALKFIRDFMHHELRVFSKVLSEESEVEEKEKS